jgi:hypothetical protein
LLPEKMKRRLGIESGNSSLILDRTMRLRTGSRPNNPTRLVEPEQRICPVETLVCMRSSILF